MKDIFTFTRPGNKHPSLFVTDDKGETHQIANLNVPTEEFWQRLGDALGIIFTDHEGHPVGVPQ